MKIIIEYESSWRNSFLDGNNNEPLPKNGRNYIAASANINDRKKPESFKEINLSNNTIYGILNRLIGDQRKLYQAKQSESYFFENIESQITFIDNPQKLVSWNELVYLRNMTGSFDRESYIGSINTNHWLFNSSFSNELWSVAFCNLDELLSFISGSCIDVRLFNFDPRNIVKHFGDFKPIPIKKLEEFSVSESDLMASLAVIKKKDVSNKLKELFPSMQKSFEDIEYIKSDKLDVRALYCSALYLKLIRLSELDEKIPSNIKGVSVAGLTPKDFMGCFTRGKKKVYGNPYVKKEKVNEKVRLFRC